MSVPHQICLFHEKQVITNMCVDKMCLMPLCPSCIPLHIQEHINRRTQPYIDTIEDCRLYQISEQQRLLDELKKVYDIVDMQTQWTGQQSLNVQIETSRAKILTMVNTFFDSLQKDVQDSLAQQDSKMYQQYRHAEVYLQQKTQELQQNIQKLNGPKFIKQLIKVSTSEYRSGNESYLQSVKFNFDQIKLKSLKLDVDESKLYTINMELSKFISIANSNLRKSQDTSRKYSQDYWSSGHSTDQSYLDNKVYATPQKDFDPYTYQK